MVRFRLVGGAAGTIFKFKSENLYLYKSQYIFKTKGKKMEISKESKLYHFEKFDPDWLRRTVVENRIFMSKPAEVNDPLDCIPNINTDVEDNPDNLKQHLDLIAAADKSQHHGEERQSIKDMIKGFDANPETIKPGLRMGAMDLVNKIKSYIRFYCLTPNSTDTSMWYNYADSHKGICLEFKTNKGVFRRAIQVEYVEELPSFQFTKEGMKDAVGILNTKLQKWSYEEECRLIGKETIGLPPEMRLLDGFFDVVGNYLTIPCDALHSVIVGCQMEDVEKASIKKILEDSRKKIKLKQAVLIRNEITIKDL
jgi:hypothetical protein